MSELRKKVLGEAKRIVVKVGSRILVDPEKGGIRSDWIARFAVSMARLRASGRDVVVVSSGAVGTGMAILGYQDKPKVMAEKQACAAVGQIDLMHAYRAAFGIHGLVVAQILLSAEDCRDRTRYKNLQGTMKALLRKGVIPIVNENDSVATTEIKVGDNDKLSADVALILDADLLLLFTDEDGLFDSNPKENPNARLIGFVPEVTPEVMALGGKPGQSGSSVSTGGMHSKLQAVREATRSGCSAFLASGLRVLPHEVVLGDARGTLFPGLARIGSRKKWLSYVSTPRGHVTVDNGGVKALREKHSSLLPVGVLAVQGRFAKGDLVEVRDLVGNKVARGVSHFDSERLQLVLRCKTPEVHRILGTSAPEEVIHKNDMVLL